jgi:hypothetical protein
MNLSHLSRIIAAIITILSLLFTQLALASYDCPQLRAAPPAAMSMHGADMPGCANMANMANMDTDQPGLCHAHCTAGSQTVDTPHAPLVAPFVAAALTAVVCDAGVLAPSHGLQRKAVFLERSTAPPLAIRHCCFRI